MNTIKGSLAAVLLLVIFALPALTATQLVGVLGEKSEARALTWRTVGGEDTFVRLVDGKLTISYLTAGIHPVVSLTNNNSVTRVVRLSVPTASDGALLGERVTLLARGSSYLLYDHSVQAFNDRYDLAIPPGETTISVEVKSDSTERSYGTVILTAEEF